MKPSIKTIDGRHKIWIFEKNKKPVGYFGLYEKSKKDLKGGMKNNGR